MQTLIQNQNSNMDTPRARYNRVMASARHHNLAQACGAGVVFGVLCVVFVLLARIGTGYVPMILVGVLMSIFFFILVMNLEMEGNRRMTHDMMPLDLIFAAAADVVEKGVTDYYTVPVRATASSHSAACNFRLGVSRACNDADLTFLERDSGSNDTASVALKWKGGGGDLFRIVEAADELPGLSELVDGEWRPYVADILPGDTLDDLPGDTLDDLPADTLDDLPGDTLDYLPGDTLDYIPTRSGEPWRPCV
jgi:hypothetical protein